MRLLLANDFLFKVDIASMKESLEVRVPMLDEDLFAFGLTLPFPLKVRGQTGKRVLRHLASSHLPHDVAVKSKQGFGIPIDAWVDQDFKERIRMCLLGPSSPLKDHFNPGVYGPWVDHFARGVPLPGITREGLYQRVFMLLSLWLALSRKTASA